MADSLLRTFGPSRPFRFAPFSCTRHDDEGVVRLSVAGELDLATTPQLERTLRRAQVDSPLVVLDLRELEFTSWCGVRSILAASLCARKAGGRLVVVSGPTEFDRLVAVVGLELDLEVLDRPPRRLRIPRSWSAAA